MDWMQASDQTLVLELMSLLDVVRGYCNAYVSALLRDTWLECAYKVE